MNAADAESTIQHLAIKTGTVFTLVTVDAERNQCTVSLSDAARHGGAQTLFVQGTSEKSIKEAAAHPSGHSYKTLRELRADAFGEVSRRRDLDC